MKRYRVCDVSFDARANSLQDWSHIEDESVRLLNEKNVRQTIEGLRLQYGEFKLDQKIARFKEIGIIVPSILAYHNQFLMQCRDSYVIGAFYPALIGICCLAERTINHLMLELRHDFKSLPTYKKIYRNESFDNWEPALAFLSETTEVMTDALEKFEELRHIRNKAVHYNQELYSETQKKALDAFKIFLSIVDKQFGLGLSGQPWIINGSRGEFFIKKEYEHRPFVNKFYLPNCKLVGPNHSMSYNYKTGCFDIIDPELYEDIQITDKEFIALRNEK